MKQLHYVSITEDELIRGPKDLSLRHELHLGRGKYHGEVFETHYAIGPCDSALPFPMVLHVYAQARTVSHVEVEIGFLHQGVEKSLELQEYACGYKTLARLCPHNPAALLLGYQEALERCMGLAQPTLRVQFWRMLLLELGRMHNHLAAVVRLIGLIGQEHQRVSVQEVLLKTDHLLFALLEHHAPQTLGFQLSPDKELTQLALVQHKRDLEQLCVLAKERVPLARSALSRMLSLVKMAHISQGDALSYALSGPALRATGRADDLRLSHAPWAYAQMPLRAVTHTQGHAMGRTWVRLGEIEASATVVENCLQQLLLLTEPDVTLLPWPATLPVALGASYLEAPEGEQVVMVASDGSAKPERVRIRSPHFALVAALPEILKRNRLEDVGVALASLNLNGFEVDR